MKIFRKAKDGGPNSPVDGYFIVEIKSLFSIVLLKFNKGYRDDFHSHAFNAFTWFLSGNMVEEDVNGTIYKYTKSIIPKLTKIDKCHRVIAYRNSWCLSLRGPWRNSWFEINSNKTTKTILTHGRKIVGEKQCLV